ncbi:hypothetical protein M431DRAFT_512945 [Trichoderma harzianum CBS 226.95]|uniref:Uncharacterized protein n=1 Tax=Trichoderma harzianum CBS 226.95 TaxID=983964 RepID=A0A2T3ZXH9_TRIHA|nr:hypothetical protein M431DRAFT_512945 [Trichoderma harzianum CBS 226.95]PTB49515.1 hypothetical protein M431DRAFT_512945 [Trichoderma harzianum CBS 226.95]
MCIEGTYMNWFVVTDPQTPIFVEMQQLRDSFLVPCRLDPSLKEAYIKAKGNQFHRRTLESLPPANSMDTFNFWSVSYDGRVCMVIGNMPGDPAPGMWSRSDLRNAWGMKKTDTILNMIRAEMDHPYMDNGRKKNILGEDTIDELRRRLGERGKSVEGDLTKKLGGLRF